MSILSASQVVGQLQSAELTVKDLRTKLLKRIEKMDRKIAAFIGTNSESELPPDIANKPLAGLPISVKDQFHIIGTQTSFGMPNAKTSKITAPIVDKLFNEGATLLGKTSLPPYAMDFQTNNSLRGFCNNPWNLEYTCGGSSGGGAAAVASGMSFVDIGADLAGSLRIPASFCGVFSLLPTEGVFNSDGMLAIEGAHLQHFARPGPITRSPQDLQLIWQALSNEAPIELDEKPLKLAIGKSLPGKVLDEQISSAIDSCHQKWALAGNHCIEGQPPELNFKHCWQLFGRIMGYETGALMPAFIRWIARLTGRSGAVASPNFVAPILQGYRRSKKDYQYALTQREQLIEYIDGFMQDNDAWILPVTCTTAFKHIEADATQGPTRIYKKPLSIDGHHVNYNEALTAYTTPIGLLGLPVVTMPVGIDRNGVPFGVQVVGSRNGEAKLIAIAERLYESVNLPNCPIMDLD